MNRELVEGATHPDRLSALIAEKGADWECYDRDFGGSEAAKAMIAHINALNREDDYGSLFPSSDERIMTRLGEEGVILTLPDSPTGPFGSPISRIALPAHWSQGISGEDEEARVVSQSGECMTELAIGEKRFLYSRSGLEKQSLTQ